MVQIAGVAPLAYCNVLKLMADVPCFTSRQREGTSSENTMPRTIKDALVHGLCFESRGGNFSENIVLYNGRVGNGLRVKGGTSSAETMLAITSSLSLMALTCSTRETLPTRRACSLDTSDLSLPTSRAAFALRTTVIVWTSGIRSDIWLGKGCCFFSNSHPLHL